MLLANNQQLGSVKNTNAVGMPSLNRYMLRNSGLYLFKKTPEQYVISQKNLFLKKK